MAIDTCAEFGMPFDGCPSIRGGCWFIGRTESEESLSFGVGQQTVGPIAPSAGHCCASFGCLNTTWKICILRGF